MSYARLISSIARFVVPVLVGWMVTIAPLRGGIYSPNEPCYFDEFDPDGLAKPIGYSNFKIILTEILRLDPREGLAESKNRHETRDRIQKYKSRPVRDLSPTELAGYTADLIRLGGSHLDDALNLLLPLSSDRRRVDFFIFSHLSKVHQERQEYESAYRKADASMSDVSFPKTFPGYRPDQLVWLRRVESKFNLPLLRSRWQEGEQKRSGVQENPDPLFPIRLAGKEWHPVHYSPKDGEYQAGLLTPSEAEKLPPDAVAVVQQLILWNPKDPRLLWQLAELYNAKGDVRAALELMDECVNYPRNYSNRTLMEHRAALRAHQDRLAAEESRRLEEAARKLEADKAAERTRTYLVGGVIGGIVVLLLVWQFRQIARKW
jgi:hypothetical protein